VIKIVLTLTFVTQCKFVKKVVCARKCEKVDETAHDDADLPLTTRFSVDL